MSQNNPILMLVERVQHEQLSHEQEHKAVLQLIDQGLFVRDIEEALDNLNRSDVSSTQIAIIGETCIDIRWHTRETRQDKTLIKLSQLEARPISSVRAIMEMCDCLLPYLDTDSQEYGKTLLWQGLAVAGLANFGIKRGVNSRWAMTLFEQAMGLLDPSSMEYGRALIAEGQMLDVLVAFGLEPFIHREKAADLYERGRACLEPGSREYALALLGEAGIRNVLGHAGAGMPTHLQRAEELFRMYHEATGSEDAIALADEAAALKGLADCGIDAEAHLRQALELFEKSCSLITVYDCDYGVILISMGLGYVALGNANIEPDENREQALKRFEESHRYIAAASWEEGLTFLQEAFLLNHQGAQSMNIAKLQNAITQHEKARLYTNPQSWVYAMALGGEAISRMLLARSGMPEADAQIETQQTQREKTFTVKNLETVVRLCDEALQCFESDYLVSLMLCNKGQALALLAQFGEDREANYRQALELLSLARERLHLESAEYGRALVYEAGVLHLLIDVDPNWRNNARRALNLCEQAVRILPPGSLDYDHLLVNAITTTASMLQQGFEPEVYAPKLMDGWLPRAGGRLIPGTQYYRLLLNAIAQAGTALCHLAEYGIETGTNRQRAKTCFDRFLEHADALNDGRSLLAHAQVRFALFELGIEPEANAQKAIDLYSQARERLALGSQEYGRAQLSEASARTRLAHRRGRWSTTDLEKTIRLCQEARERLDRRSQEYANALTSEALAHQQLARRFWIDPVEHLQIARKYLEQVLEEFAPASDTIEPSVLYTNARINLTGTLIGLAQLDIDREYCVRTVREILEEIHQAPRRGLSAHLEAAQAWFELAELPGADINECLQACVEQCDLALHQLTPESWAYGHALLKKGAALQQWSTDVKGEDLRKRETRLTSARAAYNTAHKCFDPQSGDYINALAGEAVVLWYLALLGAEREILKEHAYLSEDRELLMRQAMNLQRQVIEQSTQSGAAEFDTSQPLCIRGHGLWLLHEPEAAYRCMKEGLEAAEATRGRMKSRYERSQFLNLNSIAGFYSTMVRICLGLADQAPSERERQEWLFEAWHWVHRSKSRNLREQLAGKENYPSEVATALTDDWAALSRDLDRLEKEIRRLKNKKDGTGDLASLSSSAKPHRKTGAKQPEPDPAPSREASLDQIQWLQEEQATLLQRWKSACKPVLQHMLDKAWGSGAAVPQADAVLNDLRALAKTSGQTSERSLLVEFMILSDDEFVAFLVPLWSSDPSIPQIVVHRHQIKDKLIVDMAWTLHKAVLQELRPDWTWADKHMGPREEVEAPEVLMQRLMAQMGANLIEPWGHHLRNWKPSELILAPHWLLNLLPLHAALWKNDQGKDESLIASYPVTYLPSAALASEIQKRRKPLRAGKALLVGDPTGDLRSAQDEIQWIRDSLKRRKFTPELLMRRKATTEAVFERAQEATILHLATHSVYKADFLRSGFELADRRMTIMDMLVSLKLPDAVLAYLGSCDSGYQEVDAWNELMALVRVFLQAGSPTVVASLWPVDDTVAAEFAAYFYKGWLVEDLSLSEAFQKATLAIRKDHKEVLHWAPFTLMGAWNNLIDATTPDHS